MAGIAVVVAVVAAVTVATLRAGAVVIGAVVVGAMAAGTIAVGSRTISDIVRGEVSSTWDYMTDAFRESMIGAASGAIFGPFAAGARVMGQMVVGGVTGVFENVVSQLTDNREGFSLGEVLFSGGVGFLFGGVLDVKIARRTIGDYLGSGIGKITPDWLKRGFGSIFDSFGSAVQGLSRWGSSLGGKFLYHIRDFGSRLAKDIQALPNTIRAQSKEINAKIKSWLEETGQNLNRALQGPQFAFNGGYRNGSRDVFSDPHVNRVDNGSSSGSRGPEGKGESANNFKWGNPKSTPTYGHTFSEHGAKKKPNQLIDRARGKGHQISQWLDEKSAADFLAEVAKKGPGVHDVPLPSSIKSRGYLPDGTEIKPDMARVIVKEDGGIRSAFPYSSAHPSGIGK